jgi:SAM-dependent methyltransferase
MMRTETPFEYMGDELEIFKHAHNWKRYWGSQVQPYLGQRVLEVGAGIGGTTQVLCSEQYDYWLGIEPDQMMLQQLLEQQAAGMYPSCCEFKAETIQTLSHDLLFDSIIYIDVLEHIEQDKQEVTAAVQHLRPGGYLIVLSPAFQFLYTPFDKAIGHYRRYTRKMLRQLTPPNCQIVKETYLDTTGMLASLTNLLFLRASQPSVQQILFWDRLMIPISRYFVDHITFHQFGRSILFIWQKMT